MWRLIWCHYIAVETTGAPYSAINVFAYYFTVIVFNVLHKIDHIRTLMPVTNTLQWMWANVCCSIVWDVHMCNCSCVKKRKWETWRSCILQMWSDVSAGMTWWSKDEDLWSADNYVFCLTIYTVSRKTCHFILS